MRDSIGGAWLYGIAITFTLFFVAFLSISANYNKVFRLKNELISFIERGDGITTNPVNVSATPPVGGAIPLINDYLFHSGYSGQGSCYMEGQTWYGIDNYDQTEGEDAIRGKSTYYYCYRKVRVPTKMHPNRAYYEVGLFFSIDLPVIGHLINIKVTGITMPIQAPADVGQLSADSDD